MKLNDNTKLEFVTLRVKNLSEMKDFYTNIIGLSVMEETDNSVKLGVDTQPILELITSDDVMIATKAYAGLYHFAILVPDEKYLGKILYHLFDVSHELSGAGDHLYSQALYTNDPEGNGIEIYADRPRSEWTINPDGTIVGATEAVDVQRLLEISDTTPWTGLPSGTKLGHVHLQVSDINNAREFYVNELGYDVKTDWNSALFVSKNGYHHDLGLNIWSGKIPALPENVTGLVRIVSSVYTLEGFETLGSAIENGYEVIDKDGILSQYILR